jgi:hypothetical protein
LLLLSHHLLPGRHLQHSSLGLGGCTA